jgi:hypothetical protein
MLIVYGALKAFKELSRVLPEFLTSECENESEWIPKFAKKKDNEWIPIHGLRGSCLYGRSPLIS